MAPPQRRLAERLAAPVSAAHAYPPVLGHLDAELAALESDLGAAEDAYGTVKQRAAGLRRRRDRAVADLYRLHAPLQRLLISLPELRDAGIALIVGNDVYRRSWRTNNPWTRAWCVGPTPKAPRPLADQAARTVDLLRQLQRDPPPPIRGVIIDPGAAAADLEGATERLAAVLEEFEVVEARAVAARAEAEATIALTDRQIAEGPHLVHLGRGQNQRHQGDLVFPAHKVERTGLAHVVGEQRDRHEAPIHLDQTIVADRPRFVSPAPADRPGAGLAAAFDAWTGLGDDMPNAVPPL